MVSRALPRDGFEADLLADVGDDVGEGIDKLAVAELDGDPPEQ